MAEPAVKRSTTPLDPMFHIPEGVDELVYSDNAGPNGRGAGEDVTDDSFFGFDTGDYSDTPGVPDILGIISQTIRTNSSGNQVVDVVLDVEDMDDLTEYEVRVTKI